MVLKTQQKEIQKKLNELLRFECMSTNGAMSTIHPATLEVLQYSLHYIKKEASANPNLELEIFTSLSYSSEK